MRSIAIAVLFLVGLAACQSAVDTDKISLQQAPASSFKLAQGAASTCARHMPDTTVINASLQARGFVDVTAKDVGEVDFGPSATIWQSGETYVLVGSRLNEKACIVGLKGMTPGQSLALAQPWVNKFGAISNADRGQGLANNAVQAWASLSGTPKVYIAAYKTWEFFDEPGAAARLLYRPK